MLGELDREFGVRDAQRDPDRATEQIWKWSRTTAWRRVKEIMAAASITGTPAMPKGLRHGIGVNAFQSNVPPHLVQRWLGHASLRTTSIYGDVIGPTNVRLQDGCGVDKLPISCEVPSAIVKTMLASRFESLLAEEVGKTDLSRRAPNDMLERFESLRGYRLLPAGRTKNVTPLSLAQMATAILAIATVKPGYAGLAGKTLSNLHPVGGAEASFLKCATLGSAVECLLQSPAALDAFVELRVSDSEIYINAHGRGAIMYRSGGGILTAYYVHQNACSLFQSGSEKDFVSSDIISSAVTETVFYPPFFRRIVSELKREASAPPIPSFIDPRDEDEETRKEERIKRLGILPNSKFLNLAVDNQVTWPPKETVVNFEGHRLILMPPTCEHTTSIHIDLVGQRIASENAVSLINRFLSLMTWCDDNFAILQEGWSGNPIPVPVPKRNLGLITAYNWCFDRKIPASPEACKALALYREGRNAEQNYFISYAILSYYKIIELKFGDFEGPKVRGWIAANYPALKADKTHTREVADFEKECGNEEPQKYLNSACRVAVAHSSVTNPSDPDELPELRRLHVAAHVLRALARCFIRDELGVSECPYDGS